MAAIADDASVSSSESQCILTNPTVSNYFNRDRQQRRLRIDVILLDGSQRQVSLDYRANGQDCLDEVCHSLGVFHEVNYFGLIYYGAKREELWINMRNRLYKQLPSIAFGGVCRLYLRVKFYVPPHMMLHEETRHQVYLDVRNRLLDRHHWLLDSDLQGQNQGQSHESGTGIGSSASEDAQFSSEEPLAARLAALIVHADYFGGDTCSVSCNSCPQRHRQILSRLLDFDNKKDGSSNREEDNVKEEEFLKLCKAAADCHSRLSGLSSAAAEYRVLQTASASLSMYGSHYHDAKDHFDGRLTVAVGPDAVWLCRPDAKFSLERYPYPRVQQVTISDRFLYLSLSQENGNTREIGFRLATPKAANCLYRCVTETHSFFRCDTVRNNVAKKTCRDVKGAFVSLFVERDMCLARNFVFDVQHTAKEVHDHARRQMHKCQSAAAAASAGKMELSLLQRQKQIAEQFDSAEPTTGDSSEETRISLLERIRRLEQSRLCQICSDASVSIVFLPCGHMLACGSCANRLEICPICRSEISNRQACFVPWQD